MTQDVRTPKRAGDLVLGENGRLFIVDKAGRELPHEQPHRKEQRLRAERWRAQIARPDQATPPAFRFPVLSFFRGE